MARFDVYRMDAGSVFGSVVELQSDEFLDLVTTVVAPLVDPRRMPIMTGLNPVFTVRRQSLALYPQQMVSLPRTRLGERVATLAGHEYAIMQAIDRLLSSS